MSQENLALLREQIPSLLLGTIFSFVGLAACLVVAIRRRREVLVLLWFGCFIGMYGIRLLAQASGDLGLLPHSPWPDRIDVFVTYMLLVPALMFWIELSLGAFRRFLWWLISIVFAVGVLGLGYFAVSGSPNKLLPLNHLLAIILLIGGGVVAAVPKLSRKFLAIQSRVLAVTVPALGLISLYYNASGLLGIETSRNVEPAGYVVWVFALGYVAAERVFANERRLLSLDSELETARQIQFSILPEGVPAMAKLRVAASYQPMSAVAGDFYQFIRADEYRLGVLVADVSGHGVPAALISSMIKVAMQSVAAWAADPARVLVELNRILSPELQGQLISAAYLWIDSEHHCARYSAAGHPPLLYWRHSNCELRRVESNGLLFGVAADGEYPVCSLALQPQDRIVLYTDGVIEPESAAGEAFGHRKLSELIKSQRLRPGSELVDTVLSQLHQWPPESASQQDDITLIVIDVL